LEEETEDGEAAETETSGYKDCCKNGKACRRSSLSSGRWKFCSNAGSGCTRCR